jgi:hypothetical protein
MGENLFLKEVTNFFKRRGFVLAKVSKGKVSKSTQRHGDQYRVSRDLERDLSEAKDVLEAVRKLSISRPMMRHVVK